MKNRIVLLLFSLLSWGISAQNSTLKGRVTDTNNQPLKFVTVRLLDKDSTMVGHAISDSLGHYSITNVEKNTYLLAFSSIAYEPKIIPVEVSKNTQNMPLVTLNASYTQLEGVDVAARTFVRTDDGKLLINPSKEMTKHSKTGYALLYNLMIPGLNVDKQKGKVSTLLGDATLYIDGRKVDFREVQNLRPGDVERIEYHDNPSGRYAGDVTSINYITKKRTSGGYVSVDGKQTIVFLGGDYNFTTKVVNKKTDYTLFGGYALNKYKGLMTDTDEQLIFPEYTVDRQRKADDALTKNNHQYVQLLIKNQNDKRTLSAKATMVRNESPENTSDNQLIYSGHYNSHVSSKTTVNYLGLKPSLVLYGGFNLPKQQYLDITLSGSRADNQRDRSYLENDFRSYTETDETFYNMDASVVYSKQMKKNNSLTSKLYHLHRISDAEYRGDYNSAQHLWSGESIWFLNYTQQIGQKFNLMLEPGLSVLQYKLKGYDKSIQYSPRLHLRLMYMLTQQSQLMLVAGVGNSFPEINYMNDADQVVDSVQIKRGNPHMKSEILNANAIVYNLFFEKFNVSLAGAYNYFPHVASLHYYVEGDKMISSFDSDNINQQFHLQMSATWRPSKKLHIKGEVLASRIENSKAIDVANNYIRGRFDANYYIKNFAFNLFYNTPEEYYSGKLIESYKAADYGLSVAWNHKQWSVEAGANSPFTKEREFTEKINLPVYSSNKSFYSRNNQQYAYVKVLYTFDFGKKVGKTKESVDKGIDSGTLKVE